MSPPEIFSTTVIGSTLILEVRGPVSGLADDRALGELDRVLAELQGGPVDRVLVDFGQSPYFGSIMLETLRRIWNDVHGRQGRMVLCNVSPVGQEILQVAKFDQIWPIVATRSDAERRLQSP